MQSSNNQNDDCSNGNVPPRTSPVEGLFQSYSRLKSNIWPALAAVILTLAIVIIIANDREHDQSENLEIAQQEVSARPEQPVYTRPPKAGVPIKEKTPAPIEVPEPADAESYILSVFGALDDTNFVAVAEKYQMLHDNNLFDMRLNPKATGGEHDFRLQANNQVVFDAKSGLYWQKSGSGKPMKMGPAQSYLQSLNEQKFGGYADWRLPTLKEAIALLQPKANASGLHIAQIFDQAQYWVWTGEALPAGFFWIVLYKHGYCGLSSNYSSYDFYVRAVRP